MNANLPAKPLTKVCSEPELDRALATAAVALGVRFVLRDRLGERWYAPPDTPIVGAAAAEGHVTPVPHPQESDATLTVYPLQSHVDPDPAAQMILQLIAMNARYNNAIAGMAAEICDNYEELNLVYDLCPQIASKQNLDSIGRELVTQTSEILGCQRVSLLAYDEESSTLRVLAGVGLPRDVDDTAFPADGSVCQEMLLNDEKLILADMAENPHLQPLSRGTYDSTTFAIARMPLRVHGQLVGLLTATERRGNEPFTARDGKLMMALATMGAISLQNARLTDQLNEMYMSVVQCLAGAVDAKDPYTHNHSARVSAMSVRIAQHMGGFSPHAVRDLRLAALVHDVGKIGVPESILCKPSRVTEEEWALMQKHPEMGAKILSQVKQLEKIAMVVLYHHERYDGNGYPAGLTGEEIPLHSRIISVADTYDAITTARSYRDGRDHDEAVAEIKRSTGTQLDPAIVNAFLEVVRDHPAPAPEMELAEAAC